MKLFELKPEVIDGDAIDQRPGFYYVSVVDGDRVGLLAGPFTTHADALAMKEPARETANKVDSWSHFYAFGTCRFERNVGPGVLNVDLGIGTSAGGAA